jgi:enterochelin esterase-like enzyme
LAEKTHNLGGMAMKYSIFAPLSLLLWFGLVMPGHGAGSLHGPERIHSELLGYDLQYWIYLPESTAPGLPELYVTDGQGYLSAGHMVEVLEQEISAGRIAPVAVIFVDSRDPDQPGTDRRNEQFMCNADYGRFFVAELLPEISARWTQGSRETRRGLQGVSFGAVNAACFGLMMPGVFQVLILQSPASADHMRIVREQYKDRPRQPAAFLVSHGGRSDNATAARRFVRLETGDRVDEPGPE